jgi:hypothetical protein
MQRGDQPVLSFAVDAQSLDNLEPGRRLGMQGGDQPVLLLALGASALTGQDCSPAAATRSWWERRTDLSQEPPLDTESIEVEAGVVVTEFWWDTRARKSNNTAARSRCRG